MLLLQVLVRLDFIGAMLCAVQGCQLPVQGCQPLQHESAGARRGNGTALQLRWTPGASQPVELVSTREQIHCPCKWMACMLALLCAWQHAVLRATEATMALEVKPSSWGACMYPLYGNVVLHRSGH